mgnify:FL=1
MYTIEDIVSVISHTLELPETFEIKTETPIADVPGWDSFAWIAVISALEEHCGHEFPIDRIDGVRTIGDLVAILRGIDQRLSS